MNLVQPLTFSPFGFARASEASFYNSDGLLEFAANDVLRQGYNPETLELIGPILEPAGENIFLQSNDFDEAEWEVSGAVVITPGASISPDGTANATLFNSTGLTGTRFLRQSGYTEPGVYVCSYYIKAVPPQSNCSIFFNVSGIGTVSQAFNIAAGGGYTVGSSSFIVAKGVDRLPDDWFRVWAAVSSDIEIAAAIAPGGNSQSYIYGAQLERLEAGLSSYAPSSYIVSGATAGQRAADIVVSQSPSVVSINVEEDEAPVWDSGEPYLIGDTVMVLGQYHRAYQALTNNSDKFPPENTSGSTPDWLDIGATNPWRMFDMTVGAEKQTIATSSTGDLDVVMAVDSFVTAIVLLNIYGVNVRILMHDGSGNLVYEHEQALLSDPPEVGWRDFYFGHRSATDTIALIDLPPIVPAVIRVIVEGGGDDAALGKLILGESINIGCARYGTSVGILDFSTKARDQFGNNYIVKRRYVDDCDFDIQLDSERVDSVKRLLASFRASPVVYIGSTNYQSTVVFGFYRGFRIVIAGFKKSSCSVQVEGI